jgi:diguanylate cyclase (GGDEF)-like protein
LRRSRTFRTLCIGVLTVFSLAICVIGWSIWRDREQTIGNGVRDLDNLAVVFGSQVDRAIQAVDIVLQDLRRHVVEAGNDASPTEHQHDADEWREQLSPALRMIPQATEIAVVDAAGRLILSTAFGAVPDVSAADRSWFRELADASDDRLVVAQRLVWHPSGQALLVLARRLSGADGSFRGAIFATLGRDFVEGSFARLQARRDQVISISRSDGTILIRYPDTEERAGVTMPSWSPWHETVRRGGGTYRAPGPFDADIRWVAVHPLSSTPLVVDTGVPEGILLEEWRLRALVTAAGIAALLVCALLLLAVMARQFRALSASRTDLAAKARALGRSEADLRLQNQRFDAALNNMSQGLALFDSEARLVVCNARYHSMLQLPAGFARPGLPLRDIVVYCHEHRGYPADVDAFMEGVPSFLARGSDIHEFRDIDGRLLAIRRERMPDNGWIATFEDITSRRASEEKIRQLAHNDLLTGVANRSRFLEKIGEVHERLNIIGEPYAVLMLDLDRFKHVNDSLGHAAGDFLLKETVRRLQASLRSTDHLARLGGDEFAIIQSPPRGHAEQAGDIASLRESAIALSQRILDVIAEPYEIEGRKVFIGASIGVAMAPSDAAQPDELMKKADLALYISKAEGRNVYTLFSREMAAQADERHRMEADLRAGLARGEFELCYQPQIDMRTGRSCGMQAEVCWRHPDRRLLAPEQFISLAEDTGLIAAIGEWSLHTACAEAARWPSDVKIAVKVSPAQFRKSTLFDVVLCALVESGLPPERLEIEIAERVLLEHDADNLRILRQLKGLGISVALDDFGVGYSSLSHLVRFPFDKIKIDRSFTRDILARAGCAAVACALIGLGRSLDILTVATGVETSEQLNALRVAGIDQVQGPVISQPVAAAEISFAAAIVQPASAPARRSA